MNLIDIIILIVAIPMVVRGISKGFISQAVSLLALFAGTFAAYRITLAAGSSVADAFGISVTAGNIIVFAVALVAVWAILAVVGHFIKNILRLVLLEWVDHVLGGLFALGTTILVCGLVAIMFDALNTTTYLVDRQYLEGSSLYYPVQNLAATAFPYLHKIIPTASELLIENLP